MEIGENAKVLVRMKEFLRRISRVWGPRRQYQVKSRSLRPQSAAPGAASQASAQPRTGVREAETYRHFLRELSNPIKWGWNYNSFQLKPEA